MSAYRVTLLDCDLCGEVFDHGWQTIGASYAQTRRLAANSYEWTPDYTRTAAWRSWRNVDICWKHDDLTMPQALAAVDARRSPEPADEFEATGGFVPGSVDPS